MATDLILGTAGHIDHGKTSLIRALTGVNTDRLPEEKRRGITIELGFAELMVGDFRLGIVDVPGHERFVRNMLCGATGMDLAMLVVAADDSIKQQTREHLEILRLLNLPAGVIAMTKCDLVEEGWLEMVEAEIAELVEGSFLATAPLVRVSSVTGMGLDELRQQLTIAAAHAASQRGASSRHAPFRMAIDRTFAVAGHGTVVTGSISSGQCRVGDSLIIEPGSAEVRVRGIHNHDRSVESVWRGQRAAINLVGVHHVDLKRGQELASPGHLKPSKLITVSLSMLGSMQRPLKDRTRVRIHVGTAELLAVVRLLGRSELLAGESGFAQLYLSEMAATVWSQPFVMRSESPVSTIGGGRVLAPTATRLRKTDVEDVAMIERLSSSDPLERASSAVYFAGVHPWQVDDLARLAGVDAPEEIVVRLEKGGELRDIAVSPTRTLRIHKRVLSDVGKRVLTSLKKLHDRFPLRLTHPRHELWKSFQYLGDEIILTTVLRELQSNGLVRFNERGIALVGCGPKLSANEQKLLIQLIELFAKSGLASPTLKDCQQQVQKNQASIPQLLELAIGNEDLVKIAPDYLVHHDADQAAQQLLRKHFAEKPGLTVSEIREILTVSRKYAIPYCEYLDRIGFTDRQDDLRVLSARSKSESAASPLHS